MSRFRSLATLWTFVCNAPILAIPLTRLERAITNSSSCRSIHNIETTLVMNSHTLLPSGRIDVRRDFPTEFVAKVSHQIDRYLLGLDSLQGSTLNVATWMILRLFGLLAAVIVVIVSISFWANLD